MNFINVTATEIVGGGEKRHGLQALYENADGRHEVTAEGATEKECLLNLLNIVATVAKEENDD